MTASGMGFSPLQRCLTHFSMEGVPVLYATFRPSSIVESALNVTCHERSALQHVLELFWMLLQPTYNAASWRIFDSRALLLGVTPRS